MGLFKQIKIDRKLKAIQPEIDKRLMELGLLKIVDGKKIYARGTCHTSWAITKGLMKEKYDIDWKSPQDEHPDWHFD